VGTVVMVCGANASDNDYCCFLAYILLSFFLAKTMKHSAKTKHNN
jgi:hypothetical protein